MSRHRARRVATLHAPLGKAIAHDLLVEIKESLTRHGAKDVWITHENLPDLTIMASVPDTLPVEESSPPPAGSDGEGQS